MNSHTLAWFHVKTWYFFYSILLICLGYLLFEYYFIPYENLSMDEFVFAKHIFEYTYHLPYRDFPPYKGVLAYYLLAIPMWFSHTLLDPLFLIKGEIALINVACIALLSYVSIRLFDKKAVLIALLTIIANQFFIVYSSDLRVDMLSSWLCLFAALCVLDHRPRLGGVLLGVAFLISQKALWYIVALNGGWLICCLALSSSLFSFRKWIAFNIAMTLPIIFYVIFWSLLSSPSIVLYHLFYEAYIQAGIDVYMPIYLSCWYITLYRGPLLFLLWPLTFISLIFQHDIKNIQVERRLFIVCFSTIALILFILYKQPFPYNFVFTIPAYFLLYADFISWLFERKREPRCETCVNPVFLISAILLYTILLLFIIHALLLPLTDYLIAAMPFIACAFLYSTKPNWHRFSFHALLSIFIIAGIAYPLYKSLNNSYDLDGGYQHTMIELAASLTEKEGDYIAGIPYLYNKDQPLSGAKNLIAPALEYLNTPTEKLKLLLLPSLYLSPTTPEKLVEGFEKSQIKVVVNNFRIESLPPILLNYIKKNYQHFYGSIYLYAPTISPNQLSFYLKFSGRYHLEGPVNKSVLIDNKRIASGQTIFLSKGDHTSDARHSYRLAFMADINTKNLNPRYQMDDWKMMTQPLVY